MTSDQTVTVLTRKAKYILTFANYLCYFTYGFSAMMLPSVRLDIAELIGTNFTSVTYGNTVRAFGYVCSSFAVGWLMTHKINRQMGLCLTLCLSGMIMFCVPFIRTLWLYLMAELMFGIAISGIDVATNAWILEIWQESANPYMQGMHFCFALGSTIAPLTAEPFLSYDRNVTDVNTDITDILHSDSRINIPYSIASSSVVVAATVILVLYYKVPYIDPKRGINPKAETNDDFPDNTSMSSSVVLTKDQTEREDKVYYKRVIVLGCLLLAFYEGMEIATFSFLPNFVQVNALKLSKSKAAFISSVALAAFSANRLFSIAVAAKLRTRTMLYISFSLLCTGNTILLFFSNKSETMLWIAVIIIGAGSSSVYPCIMAFLEERMNVTTSVCSIFMLSTCLTTIIVPIIMGNFIEGSPMIYVYVNIFSLSACAAIFSTLYVIDRKYRRARRLTIMSDMSMR